VPLTMTHEGSEMICLRSTVGQAAGLFVSEGDGGLRLTRYRPGPQLEFGQFGERLSAVR
jgi:hypothetical protein